MKTDKSVQEYEGETLNEMLDDLGNDDVFSVLEGGKCDPDIDHTNQKILVDKSGVSETQEEESELYYKKRDGLDRITLPIEVPFHDLPFIAGKNSARRRFSEREGEVEEKLGYAAYSGAFVSVLIDLLGEYTNWGADLPDETYLAAVAATYAAGSFLRGRAEGIQEKLDEEYRQQLLEEASEYEIEFY